MISNFAIESASHTLENATAPYLISRLYRAPEISHPVCHYVLKPHYLQS